MCGLGDSVGTGACFLGFVWGFSFFFFVFLGYILAILIPGRRSGVRDLSSGKGWGSPPARGFWNSGHCVAHCSVPLLCVCVEIAGVCVIVYRKLRVFFGNVMFAIYMQYFSVGGHK